MGGYRHGGALDEEDNRSQIVCGGHLVTNTLLCYGPRVGACHEKRIHIYCNLCHASSSELISETYHPQPDFLRSWWLCSAQHSHPTWCPSLNGIHLVDIKLGKLVLCFGTLATNSSKAHRLRGRINKVHTLSSNKSSQTHIHILVHGSTHIARSFWSRGHICTVFNTNLGISQLVLIPSFFGDYHFSVFTLFPIGTDKSIIPSQCPDLLISFNRSYTKHLRFPSLP